MIAKRAASILLFSIAFFSISYDHHALAKDDPPPSSPLTIESTISETTFSSSEWVGFKAISSTGKSYGPVSWTAYNGSDTLNTDGGETRYPRGNHTVKASVCEINNPKSCIDATYSFTTTNSIPETPLIYMTPSDNIQRYTKVYFAHNVTKDFDGDVLTFEWKVDNGPWINQAPNGIFTSGEHLISIRAKDSSGAYSEIGTKPLTIVNAPPTKPVIVTYPKTEIKTKDEVTFEAFSSDFDGDEFTFEWKIDDGQWSKTKPKTVLSRGHHIVFSKAIDVNGNHSQIGYSIFEVVNSAPSAPIIKIDPAKGSTATTPLTITASGSIDVDGDEITYEIKIDDNPWQTAPFVTKLPRGDYTVYARAIDSLGAVSEFSSKILKIENTRPTKPTIEATLGPLGLSSEDVTFVASGSTDLDADPVGYQWKVNNGEWSNIAPNGKFKKGEHTVYARATDDYNGISDETSYSFTIKNSGPTVPTIVTAPLGDLTSVSNVTFTAEGSMDYDNDPLSFEWSYDNGPWISSPPMGNLSIGGHTLSVRAKDDEGLFSPVHTISFMVKKAPPSEPILSMTPTESLTPSTFISFSASSASADSASLTYYWSKDGRNWTTTAPDGTFPEGKHTVSVQIQDADGAKSNIVSRTFTVSRAYTDVILEEGFEGTTSSLSFKGTWIPTNLTSNVGMYSLTSPLTPHGGQSQTQLDFIIPANVKNATLSFDYLVRSEANKDYFSYTLDGIEKKFSGFGTWTHVTIPLQSGAHTIIFQYSKDGANSLYDDAAFIDDFKIKYQQFNK